MASYRIEIGEAAERELWSVPFPMRRAFVRRIDALRKSPRPADSVGAGAKGLLSLRMEGWVMFYQLDEGKGRVIVFAFRPRPA